MASPLTLLIGYYYGVLLRDTNADSLLDDKSSECLLSVADQSLISAGHSVHYRNWLLFEHIRHMDTKLFLVFCELVQNILPSVGSQLITGMYVKANYVYIPCIYICILTQSVTTLTLLVIRMYVSA